MAPAVITSIESIHSADMPSRIRLVRAARIKYICMVDSEFELTYIGTIVVNAALNLFLVLDGCEI